MQVSLVKTESDFCEFRLRSRRLFPVIAMAFTLRKYHDNSKTVRRTNEVEKSERKKKVKETALLHI